MVNLELEKAAWSAFSAKERWEIVRNNLRVVLSDLCYFGGSILVVIVFLFLLFLLSACTPEIPKLPRGFYCWPDRGVIVCQFIPADQETK